jgi:hypothetical protein
VLVVITGVVLVTVVFQVEKKPLRVPILLVCTTICMYPVPDVKMVCKSPDPVSSTTFVTSEQDDDVHRLIITKSTTCSISKDENTRLMNPFEAMIQEQYMEFVYCNAFIEIVPELLPVDGWQKLL